MSCVLQIEISYREYYYDYNIVMLGSSIVSQLHIETDNTDSC